MNRLKSVLEQRSKDWDPRVRRRLFSWRMFLIILLVVSVLSIGNVLMLEKLLKSIQRGGEHGRRLILGRHDAACRDYSASVQLQQGR